MSTVHPWRDIRPFLRHSLVLIVAGLVYIAIGFAYLLSEPTPSRMVALQYATDVMDYNHWGYVFMLVGWMSIVSSRWPPISETWGYTVLTGLSVLWAGFYGAGVVFGDSPLSNFSGSLSWGLIGFMWWAISGLVNPDALVALMRQVVALRTENLALRRELARLQGKEG